MKMCESSRWFLLVVAAVAVVSTAWTVDAYAAGTYQGSQRGSQPGSQSGMNPATGGMQEVQGTIKDFDRSGRMLTLDDGTKLKIPPTVQLPGEIKEGSTVKASFEERDGQKVVTSLEVERQ